MKRLIAIIAAALALFVSASAVSLEELEQSQFYTMSSSDAIVEFMTENGLTDENFSFSYLNTGTGELLSFNETKLMLAASTYKLPLNMLYCDMLANGDLEEDSEISAAIPKTLKEGETLPEGAELVTESAAPTTTAEGQPAEVKYKINRSGIVGELMEKSLLDSDNDSSELLLRYAYDGQNYDHYLTRIAAYGNYDFSSYDPEMLYDNYFPADYMMGCLKYLYEHSNDYKLVLDYLKQAQPGMYFRRYISCDAAHKYGYLDTAYNDVGIIYTETPFLLVCYTDGLNAGEETLGRLALLMAQYTDYTDAHNQYLEENVGSEVASEPPAQESAPPLTEEEQIQQMIEEIQSLESAPVTVIQPSPTPEPTPTPTPQPTPEPAPQPVEEEKSGLDPMIFICAGVIVVSIGIIVFVIISGKDSKRRRKGKHAKR